MMVSTLLRMKIQQVPVVGLYATVQELVVVNCGSLRRVGGKQEVVACAPIQFFDGWRQGCR